MVNQKKKRKRATIEAFSQGVRFKRRVERSGKDNVSSRIDRAASYIPGVA